MPPAPSTPLRLAASAAALLVLATACKDSTGPRAEPDALNITLAAGEVFSSTQRATSLSVGEGEYMLVTSFFSTTAGATRSVTVRATDIEGSGGAASIGAEAGPLLDRHRRADDASGAPRPDHGFHHRFRERERRTLEPLMEAARRAVRASDLQPMAAVATAAPPAVGDRMTIRVPWSTDEEGANLCSTSDPEEREGIVAAVSSRAIVMRDPENPSNGYSTADYQSFAREFDEKVWPLADRYFGRPSDIDGNGRVIVFFTSAVNELSPRGSTSFVAGLFWRGDIYRQRQNNSDLCPNSNEAEIFHMAVPDPTGTVGPALRRSDLRDGATSTLAHEFQHLVNSSRRLYASPTSDRLEEIWLDEGLSHLAEELLFYQETDLGPRRNITVADLRETDERREAFNRTLGQNFQRLRSYLENPAGTSPFDASAPLPARGAIWQFIRYAADRRGGSDADFFHALVNTSRRGVENLDQVLGGDARGWLQDWSVAVFADDLVAGSDPRFRHPSWNYRDIFGALGASPGADPRPFPLAIRDLREGDNDPVSIAAASAAYLRFSVAPGETGRIELTSGAQDDQLRLSVVRIR